MRQLTGADAFFLYSERPSWPMHTGSLVILDPTGVDGFGLDTIHNLIADRIHLVPEFTMKVKEVPFGLGLPMLVPDPDFTLDYHMHRIAVPSPGGPKEIGDLVGDLAEIQLDRRRPLWEMWMIEGLAGGRVALFMKVHHCILDGASGSGLAELLCDLEPNPPKREALPSPVVAEPAPRIPGDAELLVRGVVSAATSPLRMARWAADASQRTLRNVGVARRTGGRTMLDPAPATPWNGTLSPLRRFAYVSVPLEEIKAIRRQLDVKVNDVVLALCAGALRSWLLERGILPDEPLVASVPMSLRTLGDTELGNKLTNLFAPLATNVEDPIERIKLIAAGMNAAKEMGNAMKAKEIRRLSESVTPGLANLAWRAYQSANMESRAPTPSNLVISNVPGAPIPLYSGGALITGLHPVPPVVMSQGLNITVFSYLDSVDFGFTVDREKIQDPWEMAQGIPTALEELKKAAAAATAPARASRSAKKS